MSNQPPLPDESNFPNNSGSIPSVEEIASRLDRLLANPQINNFEEFNLTDDFQQRYQILNEVGRGAFGIVYRAKDTQLNREVALKIPRPEVILDQDKLYRFEAEAGTAAKLDHPCIVPIFEANLRASPPFIASAFCKGPDLGNWLEQREQPVDCIEAAEFISRIAEAVQYIHDQGILHRDLKPGNIMLEPKNEVTRIERLSQCVPRLTDFGLSRLIENSLHFTRSSLMIGTPQYMAPELLAVQTEQYTRASEVYSLGVLLYELLTLHPPNDGGSYLEIIDRVRTQEPMRPSEINKLIPSDLEIICLKCLSRHPEDRYHSAQELQQDLQRFLAEKPILARATSQIVHLRRWSQKSDRIRQAGLFAFYMQSMIIIWLYTLLLMGMYYDQVNRSEILSANANDMFLVTLAFHIPLAIGGWLTMRKRRWSFWSTLVGSYILVGVLIYSFLFSSVAFEYNYNSFSAKMGVFMGLIMGCGIQSILYTLAIPAWNRMKLTSK